MFDIKKILKRSWHILWNYKMLWVFGFFLAMAASGGNRGGDNLRYRIDGRRPEAQSGMQDPGFWKHLQGETFAENVTDALRQLSLGIQTLQAQYPVEFRMGIAAAITFFIVILLTGILTAVLRYVAETACIRMVNEYEQSGLKVGFRQAWKYGWSRAAWRVFLVNFLVHLPVILLFVVLGLVGWWIFSTLMGGAAWNIFSTIIAGIGLAFLFIFITVILMVVLYVLRDFAWRMIVLERAGVSQALRQALALLKRQWKNIGLTWLVMIGLKIAWMIVFLILIFPLLLVSIFTALGGVVAAILPSLLTAGIASLFSVPDYWPWIFAAIIALPIFFVVTVSPILLVGGWGEIYKSSVWTLTYRELKALEAVAPAENQDQEIEPQPDSSLPEAVSS